MILLPTAYFGNIEYYSNIYHNEDIQIELYEHFSKQTFRNRALIMSANGVIPLIVPLRKSRGGRSITKSVEIDYSMPWQRNAWRAIESAYRNSPYFEHYADDFRLFFTEKYENLYDMNCDILSSTLSLLGISRDICYSTAYVENSSLFSNDIDLRGHFSPKRNSDFSGGEYYQVFSERIAFEPNLSIMDLIFCEGPEAINYIK